MTARKPQDYTQSTKAHRTKQIPFTHSHDLIRRKDRYSRSPGQSVGKHTADLYGVFHCNKKDST